MKYSKYVESRAKKGALPIWKEKWESNREKKKTPSARLTEALAVGNGPNEKVKVKVSYSLATGREKENLNFYQ